MGAVVVTGGSVVTGAAVVTGTVVDSGDSVVAGGIVVMGPSVLTGTTVLTGASDVFCGVSDPLREHDPVTIAQMSTATSTQSFIALLLPINDLIIRWIPQTIK